MGNCSGGVADGRAVGLADGVTVKRPGVVNGVGVSGVGRGGTGRMETVLTGVGVGCGEDPERQRPRSKANAKMATRPASRTGTPKDFRFIRASTGR